MKPKTNIYSYLTSGYHFNEYKLWLQVSAKNSHYEVNFRHCSSSKLTEQHLYVINSFMNQIFCLYLNSIYCFCLYFCHNSKESKNYCHSVTAVTQDFYQQWRKTYVEKQTDNYKVKCQLFLIEKKIKYPKYMYCQIIFRRILVISDKPLMNNNTKWYELQNTKCHQNSATAGDVFVSKDTTLFM
jgi:hypothetical protein